MDIQDLLEKSLDQTILSSLGVSLDDFVSEIHQEDLYIKSEELGICFICSLDRQIIAIQLYSEGYQGYSQFEGALPINEVVNFSDCREVVLNKLGKPLSSGGNKRMPHLGFIARWDKFLVDNIYLHLRYSDDESSIVLISISKREVG